LILRVACKVLEGLFDKVLEASTGEEALEVARDYAGPVSLLLTDVIMPGIGGRELSETILHSRPDASVLFMSAYTEDEVLLEGIRVAEVEFIAKPFSIEGLRAKVFEVLGKRAAS
jgi:hypothetical protein